MQGEPPIFRFNQERHAIVDAVVQRSLQDIRDPLHALNDAAFHEIKRLEAHPGSEAALLGKYQHIARSLGRMSQHEQTSVLRELLTNYAWDVAGNFNPRVYRFATGLLPHLVSFLISPLRTVSGGELAALRDHVVLQGPLDELRSLAQLGTLIFVPTHLSNFDSVLFGFGLEQAGLPPATYGAGKNLFTNPFLSYFMHNLGAYRVDRRIRHGLYKQVLKNYSCVILERGYHSLFFPGGTRSRSGGVEERLKLGLAGTGIEAFTRSALAGKPRKIFFVPATINYQLTLEARTLVEDYLAEVGKSRYIIEDDESTQINRVLTLVRKLLLTEGSVVLRYAAPLDPFGNRVTPEGRSLDARGREVDPLSYVLSNGVPTLDPARDVQYTRELGEVITQVYARETVVLSTHLAAAAAFALLRKNFPKLDLFGLLRRKDEVRVLRSQLGQEVGELRDRVAELEDRGQIVLGPGLRQRSGLDLLDEAVRAWNGYHSFPVLSPDEDSFLLSDPKLLYYYQNRLAASGLAFRQGRGALATHSGGAARASNEASQ